MPSIAPTIAEFALIDRLRAVAGEGDGDGIVLGIGDDAAVLRPAADHLLVTCTDTLVAGVHFLPDTDPADIAFKALAVNLSDMAAMGAAPRWAQLALTVPAVETAWIDGFVAGWQALARPSGVALVGGDTTRGPLSVTVQLLGECRPENLLTRAGGQAGDLLAVTGHLGGAALALQQLMAGQQPAERLLRCLNRPQPQLAAGQSLAGLATACIDLSDGLAGDLKHLVSASGVAARVDLARIPFAPELLSLELPDRLQLALGGGDDYELCFSLRPDALPAVEQALAAHGVRWQLIGQLLEGDSIEWTGGSGQQPVSGWQHFAGDRQ